MSLPRFQYSGSWENPADFPTHEYSETQVRKDQMRYFTEIQTFLNRTLLPLLESGGYGGGSGSGGGSPSGNFLPRSGGAMTGPLLLWQDPVQNTEAATKDYVDNTSSLIQEGVNDAITALTVRLGQIQATVDDGLSNVTQITVEPGRIETILQDDTQRVLELHLQSDLMRAHFSDVVNGADSGMDMSAEDFRLWFENVTGRMAEILMNDSQIRSYVEDTAQSLYNTVNITPEGLSSEVQNLLDQIKSTLQQRPGLISAAVEDAAAGQSTGVSLTEEQIAAIARGVNGDIGSVTVTPDSITQLVRNQAGAEAMIQVLQDRIEQIARDVAGNQASVTVDPEQIRLQVIDAVSHDATVLSLLRGQIQALVAGDGGASSFSMTDTELRELVVGPDNADDFSSLALTATGIYGTVRNHTGQIAALNTAADELSAAVQNQAGQIASVSLRADAIQSAVEDQNGSLSTIRQEAEAISSRVQDAEADINTMSGRYTSIAQTINDIRLEAVRDGRYARITLQVGDNTQVGNILMEGNVTVSGQLSAEALYAARGEVAQLAVDQLTTDRRVTRYLNRDTSPTNFVRAYEQNIELVTGECSGATEQARTPDGTPLYWDGPIDGYTVGADGYPIVDGARVYTTTTPTAYPVNVYSYSDVVKRSTKFDMVGGIYTPIDTYGAGNAQGWNKGYIVKGTEGFDIKYISNNNGKEVGIRMTTDGFVDITGLRRVSGLNFSGWDSGSFSVSLEGKSSPVGFSVAFDSQNRPTSFTDSSGFRTTIQW